MGAAFTHLGAKQTLLECFVICFSAADVDPPGLLSLL